MKTVTIMNVPFIHIDQAGFVHLLEERIQERKKTFVVTANPEVVMTANENEEFMSLVKQADYVTADGIGVVKAAQLLGDPLPERVTGFDTVMELIKASNEKGYKIYLLGATQETLDLAIQKIYQDYPNANIVGSHNGFFDWDNNNIAEEIAELKPDMVFVALGVPRQEKWITENLHKFEHGLFMGIGGTFDAIAGTNKRAPDIFIKLNLEWLYRISKQPSRWRRALALPRFAGKILLQKAKGASK